MNGRRETHCLTQFNAGQTDDRLSQAPEESDGVSREAPASTIDEWRAAYEVMAELGAGELREREQRGWDI